MYKAGEKDEGVPLSEILQIIVKENNLEYGIDKMRVTEIWQKIMNSYINKNTKEIRLHGKTLMVSLLSSALREELQYRKADIIKEINKALNKELIDEIFFR